MSAPPGHSGHPGHRNSGRSRVNDGQLLHLSKITAQAAPPRALAPERGIAEGSRQWIAKTRQREADRIGLPRLFTFAFSRFRDHASSLRSYPNFIRSVPGSQAVRAPGGGCMTVHAGSSFSYSYSYSYSKAPCKGQGLDHDYENEDDDVGSRGLSCALWREVCPVLRGPAGPSTPLAAGCHRAASCACVGASTTPRDARRQPAAEGPMPPPPQQWYMLVGGG